MSADYVAPFKFPGTVEWVEIDVAPSNLSRAVMKKVEVAELRAILGRE